MACTAGGHAPCGGAGAAPLQNACRVNGRRALSVDPLAPHVTLDQLGTAFQQFPWRVVNASREQEIVRLQPCSRDPHGVTGSRRDLELNGSLGLVLHHDSPRGDLVAVADVADLERNEVAPAELAVGSIQRSAPLLGLIPCIRRCRSAALWHASGLAVSAAARQSRGPQQFRTVGILEGIQNLVPQWHKPGCNENPWATTPMMERRTP